VGAALAAGGIPACVYAAQNVMIQLAYQNLGSLTFNLVNQTKMLFTALMVWTFIGKKQSKQQCGCLLLVMLATFILSMGGKKGGSSSGEGGEAEKSESFLYGFVPCLLASICSGVSR
jgi:UDP-sugar transporter A1/2/3